MKLQRIMLAADTETVVYDGQESTECWLLGYCQLYTENIQIFHDMDSFIDSLIRMRKGITMWFHNLRFDGSFILNYLFREGWSWTKKLSNEPKTFTTLISNMNRWYSITLRTPYACIEIRDSAKLFPMTLAEAGKAFKTKHQKLEMEYKGKRYAGCHVTPEEMQYFCNDVFVLKEVLEFMLQENHTKLTIGSCCMDEFKGSFSRWEWEKLNPRLDLIEIDKSVYASDTADEYIRQSYKGAFCYVNETIKGKRVGKGYTYDVNSLYPYVLHSMSGNRYPIGQPNFWSGNYIPPEAATNDRCYFIRFRCSFELKPDHLPTVQIKRNYRYKGNEWLKSSQVYSKQDGQFVDYHPTLTMTWVDFALFNDHYYVFDLEILDGVFFDTAIGLFDVYIDKYRKQKETSTGGKRTEAKLFSNNLYGKLATSTIADYKYPQLNADGILEMVLEEDDPKAAVNIAQGSMVTSFARYWTITHGQLNYDAFCYSDTDSLHLLDLGEPVKGIQEHYTRYGDWKKESEWSSAIFLRQKTYAEFIRKSDGEKVYPHWSVVAAGMPDKCKANFLAQHPITDFKVGLRVNGKLRPKQIPGGVVLEETYFTLRA